MNKTTKIIVWAVVAVALVSVALAAFTPKSGGAAVENVNAAKFAELASSGIKVIDVRTQGEYDAGHIPGAVNMPVDQIQTLAASLDPKQPVAVYCATGSRSVSAADYLKQAGFTKIYNFTQGMVAWTGNVDRGAVASAPPAGQKAFDTPVMYEFYTDW